ncbi:hypothetical protein N431DRAFT_463842 [Stipitochalara longipes BDJ]|nr:hypothetical protein N431DRAFT_463842 [Stipitochalara longipes BDJ]
MPLPGLRLNEQGRYEHTTRAPATTASDAAALMRQRCTDLLTAVLPTPKNLNTDCPFLSILPAELRLVIYEYALQSRSGYVQYVTRQKIDGTGTTQFEQYIEPNKRKRIFHITAANASKPAPVPQPITALLRTCKQIFREGKSVFWKLNGLILIPDPDTKTTWVPFPDNKFLYHIPRVLLDFTHYEWAHVIDTTDLIFELLGGLVGKGALEEVTLVGAPTDYEKTMFYNREPASLAMPPNQFVQMPLRDRGFEAVLETLKKAGGPDGAIAKLKRRIVLPGGQMALRNIRRPGSPGRLRSSPLLQRLNIDTVQKVNCAFGGEFVVAGVVIYMDGIATDGEAIESDGNEMNDEIHEDWEVLFA